MGLVSEPTIAQQINSIFVSEIQIEHKSFKSNLILGLAFTH